MATVLAEDDCQGNDQMHSPVIVTARRKNGDHGHFLSAQFMGSQTQAKTPLSSGQGFFNEHRLAHIDRCREDKIVPGDSGFAAWKV
jgi:hypothetical protein